MAGSLHWLLPGNTALCLPCQPCRIKTNESGCPGPHPLQQALAFLIDFPPNREVRMYCAPFREIAGQGSPLASCTQQVQNSTKHLKKINLARTRLLPRPLKQGANSFKLLASHIAWIGLLPHPPMIASSAEILNRFLGLHHERREKVRGVPDLPRVHIEAQIAAASTEGVRSSTVRSDARISSATITKNSSNCSTLNGRRSRSWV